MMKIVVDTNIVFSAMLNTDGKIGDLIMNSQEVFEFYTVTYLRQEIDRHRDKLKKISGLTEEQIGESKDQILHQIEFISEALIPYELWHKSVNYVRDVDMDDIAFVALSEYLESKLWTGDKALREGIIAKGFQRSISTQELFELRKELEKRNL